MKQVTCLAVAAALLAGPAFADDKQMIQALDDQFAAAINKGDTTQVSAMYALGATILPPGSPPVRKGGAKAYFDAMAGQTAHFKLTADRVERISPDYLVEIGNYSFAPKADPAKPISASYVVIWKKVGGQWKLWTDIFH